MTILFTIKLYAHIDIFKIDLVLSSLNKRFSFVDHCDSYFDLFQGSVHTI